MAIAAVAGRIDPLGINNDGTTTAIDTTGSTLLVVALAWYALITTPATFTDSYGNSWTPLSAQPAVTGDPALFVQLFYSVNPVVGAGHTWTGGGETATFSMIAIFGFSGTHASAPYDQESGANGNVSSLQPGSITPSQANQLFVTAETSIASGSTLPTGYTGGVVDFVSSVNVGIGIGYKIQSGAPAAENPQWTWGGTNYAAAVMATFKEAAAAGGNPWYAYAQQ